MEPKAMSDEVAGDPGDPSCSAPTLDAWSWIARARAAAQRAVQPAEPPVRGKEDDPGDVQENPSA
jgi:hypothetical protein